MWDYNIKMLFYLFIYLFGQTVQPSPCILLQVILEIYFICKNADPRFPEIQ